MVLGLAAVGYAAGSYFGYAGLGMMIGQMIGQQLMVKNVNQSVFGPRLTDLKIQGSAYGHSIPRLYGRARFAGEMFWSSDIQEVAHTTEQRSGGGKGGSGKQTLTTTTYTYQVNVAIGICAASAPIAGVRRIWANGKLVYNVGDGADVATVFASNAAADAFRFHLGGNTQQPDALIESIEGVGNVPAYRHLAYVVLENFQLADFGNRIPNFEFEAMTVSTPSLITGPVGGQLSPDDSSLTYTNYDTVDGVGTAAGMQHNGFVDPNGVFEVGFFGYANESAIMFVDRSVMGTHIGSKTYAVALPFDPSVEGWARGPAYCQADTRCQVVCKGDGTRWWFVDFPGGTVVEIAGALGLVKAASKHGDHLYLKTLDSGTWRWFYVDLSQFLPSATLLGTSTPEETPCSDAEAWYVASNAGLKTYTHGTFTATSTVAFLGNSAIGFFRIAGGFLIQIGNTLKHVADDGTASTVSAAVASGTSGNQRYAAYGNGVWVMPATNGSYLHEDHWYGVSMTAGAAPSLSSVVQAECILAGLSAGELNVTALSSDTVTGYVIGKRGPVREALDPLMAAYFFDGCESDGKVKFVKRGGSSAVTLLAAELSARAPDESIPAPVNHTRSEDLELPTEVVVHFLNDNQDYQPGAQYARRLATSATGQGALELPLVLTDGEGKAIADAQLYDSWSVRDGFSFATGRKYAKYEPGDVVTLPFGAAALNLRLTKRDDGANGVIRWEGVYTDASVYTQNADTQDAETPDGTLSVAGPTNFALMDVPLLRDDDNRFGFYGAAAGYTGAWRGAQAFVSRDGGGSYDDIEEGIFLTGSTMGYAATVLGTCSFPERFDEATSVDVVLTSGSLSSVTRDQVLNGANSALLGDEVLQFRTATLLSPGTYRLTGFLRGRLGTERHLAAHAVDERFVLLESPATRFLLSGSADVNVERTYKAVSIGNTLAAADPEDFTYTAVNLKPLAPVHVGGGRVSGDLTLTWVRRSRLRALWRDYVDAPLGEETELYEVDIMNGSTVVRTISGLTSPTASYTAAQQTTDFGSPQSSVSVRVYQVSAQVGRGFVAAATV